MNPTSPHDAAEDDEDQEAAEAAAMDARIDDGSDLMSASASSHGGSSRARLTREEEEEVEEAEEQGEEAHAVDKILAVRKATGGFLEYEIAWEGEDDDGEPWADSWEPEANLTQDLVADFRAEFEQSSTAIRMARAPRRERPAQDMGT